MKTLVLNKSQNEEHWLPCGQCHNETKHKVLQSVDIDGQYDGEDFPYWWTDQYQIIQCLGCETVSFRNRHENSEFFRLDDESGDMIPAYQVEIYPSRVAGRHQLSDSHLLPFEVTRIYNETHSALCSKMPILAGIGIRALIEAICKEKAASGKNLEERIDSLVSMGVLTKDGAEILHSLRILGNIAAHEVTPHSDDRLAVAMNVVEHLLNGVYILPKVASHLPKRK
jgi:Domain of unknown function (DUF4145)